MKFSKSFNVLDSEGKTKQVVFQKITDANYEQNTLALSIFSLVESDEMPSPKITIERFNSLEAWDAKFNALSKKDAKLLLKKGTK